MKKNILAALLVAGSFSFANAQAKHEKATVKKTAHTEKVATATAKTGVAEAHEKK